MRYLYLVVDYFHGTPQGVVDTMVRDGGPPTVTLHGRASAGTFRGGSRAWVVLKVRAADRDAVQEHFLNDYDEPCGQWFTSGRAAVAELDELSLGAFLGL